MPNPDDLAALTARVAVLTDALDELLGRFDQLVHSEFDSTENQCNPLRLREVDHLRAALSRAGDRKLVEAVRELMRAVAELLTNYLLPVHMTAPLYTALGHTALRAWRTGG